MDKIITIDYKKENELIKRALQEKSIVKLKKRKLKDMLLFQKKKYADIFFFSGKMEKEDIKKIKYSKKVIVNCKRVKLKILNSLMEKNSKIEVFYPSLILNKNNMFGVKSNFYKKYNLEKHCKIIFFTAKDFRESGVKEFISIVNNINYNCVKFIVAGDKRQLWNLKLKVSKTAIDNKIIYLQDYENIDELFFIADIFLLPTYVKSFALEILKAMYYKCVVFVPKMNHSSEIVDIFSTMTSPKDTTIAFKIEALLKNIKDLELIKEQNYGISKEFTLRKNYQKIKDIFELI